MCKELCGQVYADYRAGKIGWREFLDYHEARVLEAMPPHQSSLSSPMRQTMLDLTSDHERRIRALEQEHGHPMLMQELAKLKNQLDALVAQVDELEHLTSARWINVSQQMKNIARDHEQRIAKLEQSPKRVE